MKGKPKRNFTRLFSAKVNPSAIILGIDEYEELLERLEDTENLKLLEEMKKTPFKLKNSERDEFTIIITNSWYLRVVSSLGSIPWKGLDKTVTLKGY